jgi:RNA polymerase sigma factor (sigma-70 family)
MKIDKFEGKLSDDFVAALIQGNQEAWNSLVDAGWSRWKRDANQIRRCDADAEDAVQEGIISAYNAIVGKDRDELYCSYFSECVRTAAKRKPPPYSPLSDPDEIPAQNSSEGLDLVEQDDTIELLLKDDVAFTNLFRWGKLDYDDSTESYTQDDIHDLIEREPVLCKRLSHLLIRAMGELTKDEKEVIIRRGLSDKTQEQVSIELGLTIDKVRTREKNARKKLRRIFDRFPNGLQD